MKKLICIFLLCIHVCNAGAQKYSDTRTNSNDYHPRFYTMPDFGHYKPDKKRPDRPQDSINKVYLDFVGTGDLQKALSSGQDLNANVGAGIIFEQYRKGPRAWYQNLVIDMSINIASTSDSLVAKVADGKVTNNRDFGTYIMNPTSAKQAIYTGATVFFPHPNNTWGDITEFLSGVNLRFVGSNNVWQINTTADPTKAVNTNMGAFAFTASIFHEFIPDKDRLDDKFRTKYSLYLGFGYTTRGIVGDLASDGDSVIRKQFLGTTKTEFNGVEFNLGFRLNNIRLDFQVPILYSGDKVDVPGLTGKQFLFTIRFIGGFGLELKPPSGNDDAKQADKKDKAD